MSALDKGRKTLLNQIDECSYAADKMPARPRTAPHDLNEPAAVTVATVDADGRPSARVVLLKGYDASGFVFYTNTLSRKGHELAANPRVAMCFFWDPLMEQVRVEGHVAPVTDAEADAYWNGPASRQPDRRVFTPTRRIDAAPLRRGDRNAPEWDCRHSSRVAGLLSGGRRIDCIAIADRMGRSNDSKARSWRASRSATSTRT